VTSLDRARCKLAVRMACFSQPTMVPTISVYVGSATGAQRVRAKVEYLRHGCVRPLPFLVHRHWVSSSLPLSVNPAFCLNKPSGTTTTTQDLSVDLEILTGVIGTGGAVGREGGDRWRRGTSIVCSNEPPKGLPSSDVASRVLSHQMSAVFSR
jgi:hypothetical protein